MAVEQSQQTKRGDTLLLAFLALAMVAVELAVSGQYGYFRDELYYLASTDHLALGYVDHPPLSIVLLALSRALFGQSLLALRLLPALAGGATVFLGGRIAREFGGGRFAQAVTALGLMLTAYLAIFHYYSMNAFDLLLWTLTAYLLLLALGHDRPRLWLAIGLVLGLAVLNKLSGLWLGAGIGVGLLLTRDRRVLATRWPWLAAAIVAALVAPFVAWQVQHGWPTVEFMRNAREQKMVAVAPLQFFVQQAFMMNPFQAPIWIAGLLALLLAPGFRRWRLFAVIWLTVVAILLLGRESKASYLAPAYPPLVAAGAVVFERFMARRGWGWLKPALIVVMLAGGAVLVPIAIPVLPPEAFIRYQERLGMRPPAEERLRQSDLPQQYADMFGWEEMVATVARVYRSLPPADRASCRIFAQNYGEAGAIDVLGPRYGLPKALSGHNSYWLWGRGTKPPDVFIIIGGDDRDNRGFFEEVTPADTIRSRYAMPYENDVPVYIARKPRVSLEAAWPRLRMYI